MKKPKLSIIVPVFRAENTIKRLVESLENQKFKEYELILVNDIIPGEEHTLKTTKEIEKLCKKYGNIVRIDMEHTSIQGHARNEGLKVAKADFITFADSDDYYAKNYFETIIPIIEKEEFDICCFNYAQFNNNDIETTGKLNMTNGCFDYSDNECLIKYLDASFPSIVGNCNWNKIYLKKIIEEKKLEFKKDKKAMEDLLFNVDYFSFVNKIYYIDKPLYLYYLDFNATGISKYRELELKEGIVLIDCIEEICIREKLLNYEKYIGLFFIKTIMGVIINESNNPSLKNANNNIDIFVKNQKIKKYFGKLKIKDMDFKKFICLMIYRFKLSKILCFLFRVKHFLTKLIRGKHEEK